MTYRLTLHAFAFDNLGSLALRGKTGNVQVHRLLGRMETPHTARGLESLGLHAELIGREAELSRMSDCLDFACGGNAQLVQLIGEAGIGKSRLVREFLETVAEGGDFVMLLCAAPSARRLANSPTARSAAVLRSAYGIAERETAAGRRNYWHQD